jgi:hypothetical protein
MNYLKRLATQPAIGEKAKDWIQKGAQFPHLYSYHFILLTLNDIPQRAGSQKNINVAVQMHTKVNYRYRN